MLYCIKVTRELEDPLIMLCELESEPRREDVLLLVLNADLNYDDDYGKIEYWKVQLGVWK